MIKSLLVIILLLAIVYNQSITPYTLLPVQTARSTLTDYSFHFYTDTAIHSNAQVAITFPFEFAGSKLNKATRVRYAVGKGILTVANCSI